MLKWIALDAEQVENMLFDLKQKSPAKFLKFATDDNLDIRAEISSFIESGVLHKVGGAIVNVDETVRRGYGRCYKGT